jgi:broad specificity phosphatase PhoE
MTKTIYLIRHGESEANAEGIYQGQSFDTSLTKTGRQQARALRPVVKQLEIQAVYTSPLKRASQTAAIVSQNFDFTPLPDRLLMEINHGSWEGKRVDQFNNSEKSLLKIWQKQPTKAKMIGGEKVADVNNRFALFIKKLPNKPVLLVTHDVVIRVAIAMAIKQNLATLWQYHLDNCSLTTISLKPPKLLGLNFNLHLNGLKSQLNRQAL